MKEGALPQVGAKLVRVQVFELIRWPVSLTPVEGRAGGEETRKVPLPPPGWA